MSGEAKSVDIKLYSISKIKTAFDEIVATDDLPVADVIAAMRDQIVDCLNKGRSVAWVISALQRSGIDLGARQIRTYLQRAGIGRDGKRNARGNTGMRTARKAKTAGEAAEHEVCGQNADAGIGCQAGGARAETKAERLQETCSEREPARAVNAGSAGSSAGGDSAEDVQAGIADASALPAWTPPAPRSLNASPVQGLEKINSYNRLRAMREGD